MDLTCVSAKVLYTVAAWTPPCVQMSTLHLTRRDWGSPSRLRGAVTFPLWVVEDCLLPQPPESGRIITHSFLWLNHTRWWAALWGRGRSEAGRLKALPGE